MTSTPEFPAPDATDLDALRADIDDLIDTPTEQLIDPFPAGSDEDLPEPTTIDAIGSEKWDEDVDQETTEL